MSNQTSQKPRKQQRKILSRIVAVIVERGTTVDDVAGIATVLEVPVERLLLGVNR